MRTTLNLDSEVLRVMKDLAEVRGVSLGRAVSDLLREALKPKMPVQSRERFPTLPVTSGARAGTLELIDELMEADSLE